MFKKTFAAIAVAGLLVLGSASAASADYTPDPPVTVTDNTPAPGQSVTITFSELGDRTSVSITVTPSAGVTLASLVHASAGSITKPVVNGSASVTFTAANAGTYVVSNDAGQSVTLTVAAASAGGSTGSGQLPATGGEVPGAIIWLGVGAIGLGGIAVAAGVARRRAALSR